MRRVHVHVHVYMYVVSQATHTFESAWCVQKNTLYGLARLQGVGMVIWSLTSGSDGWQEMSSISFLWPSN